ncbi:hypothetical protein BX616_001255 [Lobosporangium transversale]|uniref:Uncharacterized protein n=1 Tax=Lobosporangium transversale TaxID=64571 RepID=A0A1Y2GB80_9FUNG|nr:hypothetical protein BCR41DRAFT_362946 [Lobosporangium transversale]KAF9904562.1 hypothetical protein BX616_001255 [Lobosporangium transversale]ORZ04328.1 hypothetical protein BCR41DRAFT_362946 [Lobosporangium transversale]|eukprot:XP_021876486.1 hypothetical protein BCR41DRAFT_362946 [Lobosporangium transversale]
MPPKKTTASVSKPSELATLNKKAGNAHAESLLALPKVLTRIVHFLPKKDLPNVCRASRLFHSVAIPELWHTVYVNDNTYDDDFYDDEEEEEEEEEQEQTQANNKGKQSKSSPEERSKNLRLGLVRYGRFVKNLIISPQAGDIELIAKNCTRLESLDLSGSAVNEASLRILIHSDPYKTSPQPTGAAQKRKRPMATTDGRKGKRHAGAEGIDGADVEDNEDDDAYEDMNAKMLRFRSEAVGENKSEYYQWENTHDEPPSATGSKQGSKIQFPFFLERLILNGCSRLTGKACAAVVPLLGPQLKSLQLESVPKVTNPDVTTIFEHCPNLTRVNLAGAKITDDFLKLLGDPNSNLHRSMEYMDVNQVRVTDQGLVPLIRASQKTLKSFSCESNHAVTDEILVAFVEDPASVMNHNGVVFDQPRSVEELIKLETVPNKALRHINLRNCNKLTDEGMAILLKQTIMVQSVVLEKTRAGDNALLALAQSSRTYMETVLGVGTPEAWHNHASLSELKRGYVEDSKAAKAAAERERELLKTSNQPTTESMVFKGDTIKGGLDLLSLKGCKNVTNKGVRAIVRSCISIRGLILSHCPRVSLEFFRGPWAAGKHLEFLDLATVSLEVTSTHHKETNEEYFDSLRFPIEFASERERGDKDLDDNGGADYITLSEKPQRKQWVCIRDTRPPHFNTPRERTVLRNFYHKLGTMSKLRELDTCDGDYRIRVKDGLDLVLPALQQSLVTWNMVRRLGYCVGGRELVWFGKHFGYGFDFTAKDTERQKQEAQVREGKKKRISKLQRITVRDHSTEGIDGDIYDWFINQGISLDEDDQFNIDMMHKQTMKFDFSM